MSDGVPSADRLLRIEEVMARIGLRRTKIYAMISEGTFPKPYKLSRKASRWSEREVDDWIAESLVALRQYRG